MQLNDPHYEDSDSTSQDGSSIFSGIPEIQIAVKRKPLSDNVMERLPKKILDLLDRNDQRAAQAARAIDVDPSQFAKWTKGQGKPTVNQLLLLSRFLRVPMEYLADEEQVEIPQGLTEDERAVLDTFRASGLSRLDAMRALILREEAAKHLATLTPEQERFRQQVIATESGNVIGQPKPKR